MRNRVPPPIVTLASILAIYGAHRAWPIGFTDLVFLKILSAVFFFLGLGLLLWAGVLFKSNKTTVNPFRPQNTSIIVGTGPYSFTRNPMYLGMLLMILSAGLLWLHWAALFVIIAFHSYMTYAQIKPEEQALIHTFGEDYANYMKKVRRWL